MANRSQLPSFIIALARLLSIKTICGSSFCAEGLGIRPLISCTCLTEERGWKTILRQAISLHTSYRYVLFFFFPLPQIAPQIKFWKPTSAVMCYKAQMGGRGWGGEEENEMWREKSGAERLLWTSLCQWRNWIAPQDNDKVTCSRNTQVQNSAYLCGAELASDCLRGQKTSPSFFCFPGFLLLLSLFLSLKKTHLWRGYLAGGRSQQGRRLENQPRAKKNEHEFISKLKANNNHQKRQKINTGNPREEASSRM